MAPNVQWQKVSCFEILGKCMRKRIKILAEIHHLFILIQFIHYSTIYRKCTKENWPKISNENQGLCLNILLGDLIPRA